MTSDAVAWDPTLPVLAGFLTRCEELGAAMVRIYRDGTAFYDVLPTPAHDEVETLPALKVLASLPRQIREPFPLADLLKEQVPAHEQMLAALAGTPSEFTVRVRTRVQTLVPCEIPEAGHDVELRVQVDWAALCQLHMHMPLIG